MMGISKSESHRQSQRKPKSESHRKNMTITQLQLWASMSNDKRVERTRKNRDSHLGLKLYDKLGEKSRYFKEQPEDNSWVLHISTSELKDIKYGYLYDKPGKKSKRFKEQPKDPAWIVRTSK